jgi:hypothetical protein
LVKILPPALFLAAALPSLGLAAERPEGIAAAEAIAKAALGADCDMNGMEEVPMVGPEAEGFGHALYRFTYKPDYDPNGPGVEATLYQLFCGSGAYNIRNAFVLQTSDTDTPKLIAFATPFWSMPASTRRHAPSPATPPGAASGMPGTAATGFSATAISC